MPPLVSILLPSKNPGRFLKERLDSILAQTLTDWELIIVDSGSTDGSPEVFRELADREPRAILYAEQPPGLYKSWNFAIRQATGKYVYIATADDTMEPDALAKMSSALEQHPDCDLCDSLLKLVDAEGNEIREFETGYAAHHWHLAYPRDRKHIRRRYADFFAHLGGKTIYTSITQLLIRRSLFDKTGLFPEECGPAADYMWGMRASLHSDVVFLPEYLASWRIHPGQVTFAPDAKNAKQDFFLLEQMTRKVLSEAPPEIAAPGEKIARLAHFKGFLLPAKKNSHSLIQKIGMLGRAFLHTPGLTLEFLFTLPGYLGRVPLDFVFVYTYDRMIFRHTKRFYRGKITDCRDAAGPEGVF